MKPEPDALPDPGPLFRVRPLAAHPAREAGAQAAADAAGTGWQADAEAAVLRFAAAHPEGFLAENVVAHVGAYGLLRQPPDRRAYGAVLSRLARAGRLRRAGFATDAYGSPKTLWKAAP